MRKAARLTLATAFLLLATPAAADPCVDRLDSMNPWMESGEYHELMADRDGVALLGAPCTADSITAWFAEHGWTLHSDDPLQPGQAGPPDQRYWTDRGLNYCLPQPGLWRLLIPGCEWMIHVLMYEDEITYIMAGPVK